MAKRISVLIKNLFYYSVLGIILILFTSTSVFSQDNWIQYFYDNFEDGDAKGWGLGSGWKVLEDDGNFVLDGSDQEWQYASTGEPTWHNYSLQAKIRLINGNMQVNYRFSEYGRYIIRLNTESIDLAKNSPSEHIEIASENIQVGYYEWNIVKVVGNNGQIKIFFNDLLKIEFNDPDPFLFGKIAFENSDNGHVQIDDVSVKGDTSLKLPHDITWIKLNGPRGGTGYDIDIHPENPEIIYVSDAAAGIHKSIDGGKSWFPINNGITVRDGSTQDIIPIFCLTLDKKHNPDVLWAGTQYQQGVFKTVDGGKNWVRKENGIPEFNRPEFRSFTIAPDNPDVVYCGGNYSPDPLDFTRVRGFIFKTTNGGEEWEQILDIGNLVRWIRIDPGNSNIIYASTGLFDRLEYEKLGILKSIDGGQTWFQINNGIENIAAITGLVMHPQNSDILYACTGKWPPFFDNPDEQHGAVYKTIDAGETWQKLYDGFGGEGNTFTTLNFNPANPDIIYTTRDESFAKSIDGGLTWVETKNGPTEDSPGGPIDIEVHPDYPETVFIDAYGGGVFKSENGGQTWYDASKGYSGAQVYDIALLDGNNPLKIITATHNGIYKSNDGGMTWEAFNNPRPGTPFSLAINPQNQNEIILGDRHGWSVNKSTDYGETWTEVLGHGPTLKTEDEFTVNEIKFAPSNPDIVYVGVSIGPHEIDLVLKEGPGVYKSIDGGDSWIEKNNGLETSFKNILSVAVHPENENIVYIGTLEDGVFKTIDGGENWILKSNGLTATDVRTLAIDPHCPDTIYAGGGQGVGIFRSINGGEQWEEINCGINLECPSYLLPAGRVKQGVSFDVPEKFTTGSYAQLVPWTKITNIVIDPVNTQTIYATDINSGVYISQNGGITWILINDSLTNRQINNLIISNDGKLLYAATGGGGVFRAVTCGNMEPFILSEYPDNTDTLKVEINDSIRFEIKAIDFNFDTLKYSWYINGKQIRENNLSAFLLAKNNIDSSFINITIEVSDNDTSIFYNWYTEIFINIFENISICESEEYEGWSTTGVYQKVLTSVIGCDSIVTTNLTVNPVYENTEDITICEGDTYKGWDSEGTYTESLISVSGCDSTVITHLFIFPSYQPAIDIKGDTLTSVNTYPSYQWYDETGEILGETNKKCIITKSGEYYLIIVDENGCTNISEKVQVVHSSISVNDSNVFKYSIIPNPNTGKFTFRIDSSPEDVLTLTLMNSIGQVIKVRELESTVNHVEDFNLSHLSKGIYHLVISSDKFQKSEKIVLK